MSRREHGVKIRLMVWLGVKSWETCWICVVGDPAAETDRRTRRLESEPHMRIRSGTRSSCRRVGQDGACHQETSLFSNGV